MKLSRRVPYIRNRTGDDRNLPPLVNRCQSDYLTTLVRLIVFPSVSFRIWGKTAVHPREPTAQTFPDSRCRHIRKLAFREPFNYFVRPRFDFAPGIRLPLN